jgi:hypothetical protein
MELPKFHGSRSDDQVVGLDSVPLIYFMSSKLFMVSLRAGLYQFSPTLNPHDYLSNDQYCLIAPLGGSGIFCSEIMSVAADGIVFR